MTPKVRPRFELLDVLRGVAIIGVIFYHFAFDLRLLEFISTDVTVQMEWRLFARILSGAFLFLAGVNLVLAHGEGVRWRPFWRRFAVLVVASIAITAATYFAYPDMFVYFGILHAIALFSLFAIPFLRLPIWIVLAVAVAIFVAPFFFSHSLFNERLYSVIGFWVVPPLTGDLVPLFPSFALTLFGVFAMRFALAAGMDCWMCLIKAESRVTKALAWAGRWSLIIYLVHQPILLGVLYPIAQVVQPAAMSQEEQFFGACFGSCVDTSGDATHCRAYCQCSLEQVAEGNHWEIINAPMSTPDQRAIVGSISSLCAAMTR